MPNKILVVYYTQTGQLEDILTSFCRPLIDVGEVEFLRIFPAKEIKFPWSGKEFFAAMPPSVMQHTIDLEPIKPQQEKYDLIIFGYQPWFLSPSIPASSILAHPQIKKLMHNTPVITVIGARNMWLNAQEMVKKKLAENNAKLVGNVAFVDRHNNLASAASIVYWLIYGKKQKLWGIIPKAGVSDEDVKNAANFGKDAANALQANQWADYQQKVIARGGVQVRTNILFIEQRAPRLFLMWANHILKSNNQAVWLVVFKYYLFFALFVVSPILLTLYNLLIVPFSGRTRKRKKTYFQGLSLKKWKTFTLQTLHHFCPTSP